MRTMPRKFERLPEAAFYRELGLNLRAARGAAGKSQGEIAEHLDMTYQQLQKYENGANRIPIFDLISLANYLEVPVSQFIAPSDGDSEFQSLAAQFSAREFHRLMKAWGNIKDHPARATLLDLVEHMADLKS
jgi:transcriptional regulator with XRE-family HTH domain